MTVGELKTLIANEPDLTPVILAEWDGSKTVSFDLDQACNVEHQEEIGELWLIKQRGSYRKA